MTKIMNLNAMAVWDNSNANALASELVEYDTNKIMLTQDRGFVLLDENNS